MTPRRRYERLQFWFENLYGDWISLSLNRIAPSDVDSARLGVVESGRFVIGVGVQQ